MVDLSVLAAEMLEWERKRAELDELEQSIRDAVFEIGKTQTVGNVRATYIKGRRFFNYQDAAQDHPMVSDATVELFTKLVKTTDWKGICEHAGIEDVPYTQGKPSVLLKLLS
jgi:hypothetical protein